MDTKLVSTMSEQNQGELVIDYLGGPEVIPIMEQVAAVQQGVVDINAHAVPFFRELVPAGSKAMELSDFTSLEERQTGAYDFWVDLYKPAGFFYLGKTNAPKPGEQFYLWISKKITRPQELAGLKVGPGTVGSNFMKALGVKLVRVQDTEAYSALERGVTDGHIGTPFSYTKLEEWEVAPYFINHPFFNTGAISVVNLDSWNRLPKHLQDLIMEVKIEGEPYWLEERTRLILEALETMRENKVEFIEFSPADAEWWYETAYQSSWNVLMEADPNTTTKLKELIRK